MSPFQFIKSETLFKGRAFTIRRDLLRTPDNRETQFDIVDHGGSVVILPLDQDGNILFLRQYRHAAGLELLELPAGTRDGDEEPLACAGREIREETGMAAGRLEPMGGFFLAPGYSTEYMYVFLATQLTQSPLKADPDEFLTLVKIPVQQALEMAQAGQFPDAKTLAAICLARPHLGKFLGK